MKYCFLFLFLLLTKFGLANDTLTRAQVYDFSVGDTFDYVNESGYSFDSPGSIQTYISGFERWVVIDIQQPAGSDSLIITYQQLFPLPIQINNNIFDSINDLEVILRQSCLGNYFGFDSLSVYHGRPTNSLFCGLGEAYYIDTFAKGLGIVYHEWGGGNSSDHVWSKTIKKLIYYSKHSEVWGMPYYTLNGSSIVSYTPIPEQCTRWERTVNRPDVFGGGTLFKELIRTGNQVSNGGHTYIELLYSLSDYQTGWTVIDSFVGYFRNDTLNQSAYLYDSIGGNPIYTYDFTKLIGGTITGIGQDTVNGQLRARWYSDCSNGNFGGYIEGIGGSSGFHPIKSGYLYLGPGYSVNLCGELSCFSVCGETLYPNYATGDCDLITGLNEIKKERSIKLYPTFNSGDFNIFLDRSYKNGMLKLFDLAGRLVYSRPVTNNLNPVSVHDISSGMYLWTVSENNNVLQSGKVIME